MLSSISKGSQDGSRPVRLLRTVEQESFWAGNCGFCQWSGLSSWTAPCLPFYPFRGSCYVDSTLGPPSFGVWSGSESPGEASSLLSVFRNILLLRVEMGVSHTACTWLPPDLPFVPWTPGLAGWPWWLLSTVELQDSQIGLAPLGRV